MSDDSYFYLPKAHEIPADYIVPSDSQLTADTQHPELNSRNYNDLVNSNYEEPKYFLPVYSLLDFNNGVFVLGTNNFTHCTFDGNFIGTEDFDSIVKQDIQKTSFVIPEKSSVTGLKFIDENLFVGTTMNCDMYLWSCKSMKPDESNEVKAPLKCGHLQTSGYVSSIDRLRNDHKFVTASKKGYMDVYDYGLEVISDKHIFYGSPITGISTHPDSPKYWVSCSIDRNCLLWDYTKNVSIEALTLLRNYEHQLATVYWTNRQENKELVMVGDEIGNVLTLDIRSPNKILHKMRVANRGISQISFKDSNRFGVVANNNTISILEIDPNGEMRVVYKHVTPVINYAMCMMDDREEKTFYVVGERRFGEKVTFA